MTSRNLVFKPWLESVKGGKDSKNWIGLHTILLFLHFKRIILFSSFISVIIVWQLGNSWIIYKKVKLMLPLD